MSSSPEASKVFGRFTEQAHQILDLGRDEAERIGHRYLGPEHLLLGMLHEGTSGAARLLRAHGAGLEAARGELLGLAELGVVPAARPSDRALLGTLGIDLEEIRRTTERTFGATALGEATWRVTRRRGWRGRRVVWTPLCGPPFVAKRALHLAERRGGLEDRAKRNRAREEARRDYDVRKDDGELGVEGGEPVELLPLAHELPPVCDHGDEALAQVARAQRQQLEPARGHVASDEIEQFGRIARRAPRCFCTRGKSWSSRSRMKGKLLSSRSSTL